MAHETLRVRHGDIEVELSDEAMEALRVYGSEVARLMREKDPENAECWVACEVEIGSSEMDPVFFWGDGPDGCCGGVYSVLLDIDV